MNFVGMYRHHRTPMHWLPAWVKIGLLVVWTITSIAVTDPVAACGMATAAVLLLISVVPPLKPTLRAMAGIVVIALLAGSSYLLTESRAPRLGSSQELF